ncbi:MAG: hypothetical protein HC837_14975 [Chloroflexaceae bacterium]|nr:hypothetical protein [Chloroflexaceae bacterium]
MTYSDFTLEQVRAVFVRRMWRASLFPQAAVEDIPDWLIHVLERGNRPLCPSCSLW